MSISVYEGQTFSSFNSLLTDKNDVIDSTRLQIFFFSTNIYSSKECNILYERAQNVLSYRKKVFSWKLIIF